MEKDIVFKRHTCMNKYGEQSELKNNEIAMYVVLTRKCNTHCNFCEYRNGESNIDINVFSNTLDKLLNRCYITTVHFTGGEPTLELEKFKQLLKIIKQKDKLITTSVNTNGTRLNELSSIDELDNIALSRHAIEDSENNKVFGSKLVASSEDIKKFSDKHKLHLSCNLIKGYVDTQEKIIKYLEFASELGINDLGLVSLMQVNDYCKEHYIDFESIKPSESGRLIKTKCFQNISESTKEICCKCENYLYRASNMNMISLYHRYAIKNNEIADYLVYENNILKQGFNGEEIILK